MYWLLSDEESVDCFLAGDSPFRRSLVVNWTGGWSGLVYELQVVQQRHINAVRRSIVCQIANQ